MKKVLICGVIAAAFGSSAFAAGTGTADFQVAATVNAKCLSDNASLPVANYGAIDGFATGVPDATANVKFKCTRGLTITKATLSKPSSSVAGFAYTAVVDGGTKSTTGSAGGANGGADGWTFKVTASIADGQAGDAATATATTDDQVLTIEF